jgi:hypothetical protein
MKPRPRRRTWHKPIVKNIPKFHGWRLAVVLNILVAGGAYPEALDYDPTRGRKFFAGGRTVAIYSA